MMGHHFGVPYHRELQRRILLECFAHLEHATHSGEIRSPDITWAQARREGIEIERKLGLRP